MEKVFLLEYEDGGYMLVRSSNVAKAKIVGELYSKKEPQQITMVYENISENNSEERSSMVLINKLK